MFTQLIEELDRINRNYRNIPIVVEGKKDKQVLKKLGFTNIIDISGNSLDRFADRIVEGGVKSVIILTDFDEDGSSKASQLTKIFHMHHINVVSHVRQRIRSLFKIHKIEELSHITNFIELANHSINENFADVTNFTNVINITGDDYHGKTGAIHDKIFNRSRIYNRRHRREAGRNRGDIRSD